MVRHSLRRSVRPTLETLEDRCTPAGTVTGSLAPAAAGGNVWTLTGDVTDNHIKVASAGSPGAFTVSDAGGTTLTGAISPTGVKVIVFNMLGGSDTVDVNGAKLRKMIFVGGDGNNSFYAENFKLTNKLQVVNGTGADFVTLRNFKVDGNVNINNGNGGSVTVMATLSAAAGFNNIAGNVNITNGTGVDGTGIIDTNVGGNITANNGAGYGTDAGHFEIFNLYQTGKRAVVGGNVTATFQDGNINGSNWNGIWDTVVRGNVLFNNGSGAAQTYFDGQWSTLPVVIQGRLKIVGTGTNLVSVGRAAHTGLRVWQNLVIDVKNPTDLTLEAFNLIVIGQTKIV